MEEVFGYIGSFTRKKLEKENQISLLLCFLYEKEDVKGRRGLDNPQFVSILLGQTGWWNEEGINDLCTFEYSRRKGDFTHGEEIKREASLEETL